MNTEIGKSIQAALVGSDDEGCVAFRGSNGNAGNKNSPKGDLTVILRCARPLQGSAVYLTGCSSVVWDHARSRAELMVIEIFNLVQMPLNPNSVNALQRKIM